MAGPWNERASTLFPLPPDLIWRVVRAVVSAALLAGTLTGGRRRRPCGTALAPARPVVTEHSEVAQIVAQQIVGRGDADALTSAVPLNVDLDTTLTVVAGNLYRLLARQLPRYEHATPDRIWRHFLDATGTLHITDTDVTCALTCAATTPS